ncbi:unnamed protein product [Notodromas monacha]|uniref:Uncharacterized protein n=1 Tax=Notodromas monacha TaxID=399045 RepID=A0A7R9BM47_9CRUS|nr:unnamed protein product [Notodromas monacha]CAG0917141.1 unnamed protein product [Notodromas monacha]
MSTGNADSQQHTFRRNRGYGSWCTETKDCYIDDGHAPADRKKDSGLVCDRYKLCRCKNARPYWNGTSCSTSPCYSDGDCSYGHICFQFGRTCIKKADKRAAEESINWIAANMESLLKMHGLNGSHESPTRTQTRASRREFDLYSIYFVLGFVVVLLIVVMAARVYSTRPRNHDPVTINSTSRAARELPGRNFIPESRLLGREVRDSDSSSAFIRELLDECQRQLVDDRAAAGAKRTVSGELPSYDEATAPPTYNNAVQGLDESTNCDVQPARHKDN